MAGKRRGNGEGSIRKRPDGRWEARVSLPVGGQHSLFGKTRDEVAQKLTKALRARDIGLPTVGERQTVGQWLPTWLENAKPTIRPQTYRRYEQFVRVHIVPALGKVALAKLSPTHLQTMYSRMLAAGSAPRTVHHVHAMLHKALSDALRQGLVARNVGDLVDPPRAPHVEMRVLSPEQVHVLLAAAEGDRLEALYVLALSTGMRAGELLALKWADVDLVTGRLQVRATLQYMRGAGYFFAEPKSQRSRRYIKLSAVAVEALKVHHARQLAERFRMGPAWTDIDLVFPNTIGKPLDAIHLLRRQFRPLLERASLPSIRFHDLGHTAATLMRRAGVNVEVVGGVLGHADPATTLRIYSHVQPDMQEQAAIAMNDILRR